MSKKEDLRPIVLIVEDDIEFRTYLKINMDSSFAVLEAANGQDGWKKALKHNPNLIISDVAMPVMDGLELSRKVNNDIRTAHIPVVLLTGSSGDNEQLAGLETGAVDYLTKPVNFDFLNTKCMLWRC